MAKKKILIIEDERDTAKVIAKRLTQSGFDVVLAGDAYQGVAMTHKEDPDLIILDLMLPAGGGHAVLQNIGASITTSSIPVIVFTGMQDEEYKKKILSEGVEVYLEKPQDPDELIKIINNILEKKKEN